MGSAFRKPVQMASQAGIIKPVSPTIAEVSQSEAANADGNLETSIKNKRKGRSATILTSTAGVEGDATLGKKSLLGS